MLGLGENATAEHCAPAGWDAKERAALSVKIADREPFLDFGYSHTFPDGRAQYLRVSGKPIFNAACAFTGYRGIGVTSPSTWNGRKQLMK